MLTSIFSALVALRACRVAEAVEAREASVVLCRRVEDVKEREKVAMEGVKRDDGLNVYFSQLAIAIMIRAQFFNVENSEREPYACNNCISLPQRRAQTRSADISCHTESNYTIYIVTIEEIQERSL